VTFNSPSFYCVSTVIIVILFEHESANRDNILKIFDLYKWFFKMTLRSFKDIGKHLVR